MIADKPHGVDGFVCGSCCNEYFFSGKRKIIAEETGELFHDLLGLSHSAVTSQSAGKFSVTRFYKTVSKLLKLFDIGSCGRMFEHVQVHCRSEKHRTPGREISGQQKVITKSVGHFGECVRAGGGDHKNIGPQAELNVIIPLP